MVTKGRAGQVPRLSSHLVTRPRLLKRFEEGAPLTVLRAPLGFGKTTLVAQWLRGLRDDLVAWVTVDQDTADATGFWHSVLEALVDAGLEPPPPEWTRSTRLQLRRAIAATKSEVSLVVDGFERVTEDGIDRDLLDLLRVSPNLRLVVCLRSHRHFVHHSYLDLDFTVIPPGELLLTLEETAALLDEFGVADLSDERVRAIHADGGGWIEPTRAFAMTLCQSSAVTPVPPSDRDAATRVALSYLRQRILPAIDGERVEFALATSLLDVFSTELAELLAEEPLAKGQLQGLEADGILYAAVESGETVYRWPPAARRAMATELAERSPERLRHLHTRIARLYASKNQPDTALRHAINAQDWPLVVQIVEQHWRPLLVSHRDILYAALSAAPLELIAASPRALAVRDLRLQAPDDRVLSVIPDLPSDGLVLRKLGDSPRAAEILDNGLAIIAALRRRGLFHQVRDYSDRLETVAATAAVNRTSDVAAQLPGFWFQLGVTRLLGDDIDRAFHPLREGYETAANSPLNYIQGDAAAKLALAYALAGDTAQATVWLKRYQSAPEEKGWFRRLINSSVVTARTLLALDRLDIDEAAATTAATVADLGSDEFWAFAAYARALVAFYTGDALGGLRQVDQARAANPAWHDHGSTARLLLARIEADLLLALGQANRARAVIGAAGPGHPDLWVSQARLELLVGDPHASLALAADLAWVRQAGHRAQLEMLLIQAVAHHRLGQTDRAPPPCDAPSAPHKPADPCGLSPPSPAQSSPQSPAFCPPIPPRCWKRRCCGPHATCSPTTSSSSS